MLSSGGLEAHRSGFPATARTNPDPIGMLARRIRLSTSAVSTLKYGWYRDVEKIPPEPGAGRFA